MNKNLYNAIRQAIETMIDQHPNGTSRETIADAACYELDTQEVVTLTSEEVVAVAELFTQGYKAVQEAVDMVYGGMG